MEGVCAQNLNERNRDLTPTTQVAGQSWWICIQQVIIIVYRGPATVESIDIWL